MGPVSLFFLSLFFIQDLTGPAAATAMLRRRHDEPRRRRPGFIPDRKACNPFTGSWLHDDSYPLYKFSGCPFIDPQFNCKLFGRPDSDYLHFRWKPSSCDLPRFNGIEFLERMRNKKVMFVGDSLGRNQWQSLLCMIHADLTHHSPTQLIRGDPLSTFNFLEYGVSIAFYRAPYLVDIDVIKGRRILRLDRISANGEAWKGVDVLSFNSGHWWSHKGSLQGEEQSVLPEEKELLRCRRRRSREKEQSLLSRAVAAAGEGAAAALPEEKAGLSPLPEEQLLRCRRRRQGCRRCRRRSSCCAAAGGEGRAVAAAGEGAAAALPEEKELLRCRRRRSRLPEKKEQLLLLPLLVVAAAGEKEDRGG